MRDMSDIDNLIDNFEIHSFWSKRRLMTILGAYVVQSTVVGVFLIRAVLKASDAGAIPKGSSVQFSGTPTIIR